MQDASKCIMGSGGSSDKVVSEFDVDPAGFPAGLAVSLASTGLPSLLKSSGPRIGVSFGRSLSDVKKSAVCREGLKIPVQLALKKGTGNATITSFANLVSGTGDTIVINGTAFTAQAGAVTPGGATFQAATSNNATAASLAAQINAHATIGLLVKAIASSAVVNLYAIAGGAAGNAITLAYNDLGTSTIGATVSGATLSGGSDSITDIDYVSVGSKAYTNDVNGLFDSSSSASTISDAVYVSGVLTGIAEDGSSVAAAYVDMGGGL